jgi:hypothetical protein
MRKVFETNVFGIVAVTNTFLPFLASPPHHDDGQLERDGYDPDGVGAWAP